MKHFVWLWLAISSVLAGSLAAETRPQYGGTLHVAMRSAPTTLDPADRTQLDSLARRTVTSLLYDTLVTIDDSGHIKSALADSWQASNHNQRWQFHLRRGVKFHDGTPLSAEIAATSLHFANPSWSVSAQADVLVIEDFGDPELPAELALPRNAIVQRGTNQRDADNKVSGTGPFRVADWQPGKKLTLAANEDAWRGRPFLDAIEIEMGKNSHDQMTALELGKEELVEVAPEQAHRVSQEHYSLLRSEPIVLLALVFSREADSVDEQTLREALSLCVDRASIGSVLLQGMGQPTAGILPTWISGYGFVFPVGTDLPKARQLRAQVHSAPAWTLAYDANDPLARLIAERIALNARDAGLTLQPASTTTADLRLVEIPLASSDPWIALTEVIQFAGLPAVRSKSTSVEDLYAAEQAALANKRLIPLFHLPVSYAASGSLKHTSIRADGSLDLSDSWLEAAKP
jgi:peptide/nickel transport system substrate-binding protein